MTQQALKLALAIAYLQQAGFTIYESRDNAGGLYIAAAHEPIPEAQSSTPLRKLA